MIRDLDEIHYTTFALEWLFGKRNAGTRLQLELNGLDGARIMLSIGVYHLFSFYPSVKAGWLQRFMPWHWEKSRVRPGENWKCPEERQMGISIHDGYIWISLWENLMEWSNSDPWWWRFTFCPANFFLGRSKYNEQDLEIGAIHVQMPEGNYPATYRIFESTWKRPRWPWPRRMRRTEIELNTPVPIPGKGENSWDLDDDAIYSGIYPTGSAQEAASDLAKSAMRTRKKYGGKERKMADREEFAGIALNSREFVWDNITGERAIEVARGYITPSGERRITHYVTTSLKDNRILDYRKVPQ